MNTNRQDPSTTDTYGITHRLTFSSETVRRLTSDDFDLSSKELVTLKYDDCILILFHVENTESYQLANIWAVTAQQIAGPIFGAINMLSERKVASAFTRLKTDGSNPLHWVALRQYPFIVVYRKGWPVAIYNGVREVQAIIDYALTLACEAGYYEPLQIGGSMQSENNLEIGAYNVYTNVPGQQPKVRRESLQYVGESPIRGFNPTQQIRVANNNVTGQNIGSTNPNIVLPTNAQNVEPTNVVTPTNTNNPNIVLPTNAQNVGQNPNVVLPAR